MTGIEIKFAIIEARLTQRQIADHLGVRESYLSDFLRGRRPLTQNMEQRILDSIKELRRG
jgi:transcriptional regulator with XRE-family HTH domain